MRIPYGFTLTNSGGLETNKSEAENVALIFNFYMAGASLGKVVDMLYAKQIPSPTGKAKWTRAAVDHLVHISFLTINMFMQTLHQRLFPLR